MGKHAVRAGDPRWTRIALVVLLVGTAVLYLWNLGASGNANSFYAAAVQAGSQSWKAWFFGSLDSGNAMTVDKPPAALWVMGLSARIFGFSSWSMLVPQALEGVAAVGLLHAAVRRWHGPVAGLLAGAGLALTPVAALMFRYNNPDALLTLLLVAGAYCVVRAVERANPRWLALAGVALGFGFLTKMLQAFLVLPAFALVYLVAAPTSLRRRTVHLLGAAVAVVVSAGWFVAVVDLWPAASRPYIDGSTNNSELNLALGYNGLGRIFGGAGNGGGGGFGGGSAFGGSTGWTRLFGPSFGTEVSWLLPAALLALVAGLWFTRRALRTDRTRATLLLWGGWMLVTGAVFSYMQGTVHPYYGVALAPSIAALVGVGGVQLWRGWEHAPARYVLGAMVAVTGVWSWILLDRTPSWQPAVRWLVLALSVLVATAVVVGVQRTRQASVALVAAIVVTIGAASAAYAVQTAATPHDGPIPTSGPTSSGFGGSGGPGGTQLGGSVGVQGNSGNGSGGVIVRGGPDGGETSTALVDALRATTSRWAAATTSSQSAASLELASGKAVIGIGGFTGSDDSPTLAEFQHYVATGQVHYFVTGGMGGPGGRGQGDSITTWVTSHFTATTIGTQTVYDLTKPTT